MAEITQQYLVELASSLFDKYGIRSVSIDDVCHEAGISKKTFYVYFKQKEDLVNAVLSYHERIVADHFKSIMQGKTAIDQMVAFIHEIKRMENIADKLPLLYDLKKYYPQTYESHNAQKRDAMIRNISDNIHRGIDEGMYRADIDMPITCYLFTDLHYTFLNMQDEIDVLDQQVITKSRLNAYLIDLFMRFLLSDAGKAYLQAQLQK